MVAARINLKIHSLNYHYQKVLFNFKPVADFPRFGRDFAGTVVSVAKDVTGKKILLENKSRNARK